jgi:hypothetical protein
VALLPVPVLGVHSPKVPIGPKSGGLATWRPLRSEDSSWTALKLRISIREQAKLCKQAGLARLEA